MKCNRIFSVMVGLILATGCTNNIKLLDSPQVNDLYIFEENEVYFPVLVDSVAGEKIFCVNSAFRFEEAIPEPEDLPHEDFDFSVHLIFDKAELKRLYEEGNIVEVYRP